MEEQQECTAAAAVGEAFLEAVAAGDVLRVRQLLHDNPPHTVTAVDHLGWTGLMVAVEARHVEMVELLLASGADPHHRSSVDGMHALHVLAEQGQRDFCKETPAGGLLLQVLLDAGVDPNVPTSSSGETVVHLMCLRGNIEGVRELLARRLVVDIDARNAHGDTALHYAARKGHDDVVRLLVAHGASPAIEGRLGTPAQAAIEFGQHHIVELLRSLTRPNEDSAQRLGLHSLPPEVVVYMLSFVANARDLCSLSMVSRALAAVSRDDALWKPLGHPSWADHHVLSKGGWKGAYMTWLRAAVSQYRKRNTHTLPLKPSTPHDYLAKVIMQGDSGAGKSAILRRYVHDEFEVQHSATLGAAFERRCVEWHDTRIQLQLWDTSAPERFRSLSPFYFRGAHGAVVVYDIADRSTFNNVTLWIEEMLNRYQLDGLVVVLAGNKTDLVSRRAVTELEGRRKAEELGLLFCECSAKTGEGVADVFDLLVDRLMGGWQRVARMATPAHVPSEALLAQLIPPGGVTATTATAANSSGAGASAQQQQSSRCALQ